MTAAALLFVGGLAAAQQPSPAPAAATSPAAGHAVAFDPGDGRDPFTSPYDVEPPKPAKPPTPKPRRPPTPDELISVQGVVVGEGAPPRAIVNNKMYAVGDAVEGATIVEITEGSVLFKTKKGSFRKTPGN